MSREQSPSLLRASDFTPAILVAISLLFAAPARAQITGPATVNDLVCVGPASSQVQDCANITGTTPINVPKNLNYTQTGSFIIAANDPNGHILFKIGTTAGTLVAQVNPTSFQTDRTLITGVSTTLPAALPSINTYPAMTLAPPLPWSGTINPNQNVWQAYMQGTSQVSQTAGTSISFATLRVDGNLNGPALGNLYAIDCQGQTSGLTGTRNLSTGNQEIHCARFQTNANDNVGGQLNQELGYAIGAKAGVTASAGGTYWAVITGLEVVANNQTSTTRDVFGMTIASGATTTPKGNDDGIAFATDVGGSGSFSKYLIDFGPNGLLNNGPPLAPGGTLIGVAKPTGYMVANGIDLSNMNITGNAWASQGATIDGSGNATFNRMTITAVNTLAITSGSYDNTSGMISLMMRAAVDFAPGDSATLSSLTGTGSFASLNGTWTVLSASGKSATLAGPTSMGASTITGGSMNVARTSAGALCITSGGVVFRAASC